MKKSIVFRVAIPVYGNADSGLFLITTVEDDFNWVSEMMDTKLPNGEPVFTLIAVGPCKTCVLAGNGGKCPHYERPMWKSGRKYQEVVAIMEASGDEGLKKREMDGVITSSKKYLVAEKFILAFIQRSKESPFVFTTPQPVVLVGIDPHGGGDGSDTAIIDVVLSKDRMGNRDVVSLLLLFTISNNRNAIGSQNHWLRGTTCRSISPHRLQSDPTHSRNNGTHGSSPRQTHQKL